MDINFKIYNDKLYMNDNVDKAIADEINFLLEELKEDMIAINEISLIINEKLAIDNDKLEMIEDNLEITDDNIEEAIPLLEETIELKENVDKKYVIITVVSGIVVGGGICSGIGALFGVAPALIGLGLGAGSGGTVGYLTGIFL
jgi:hypothetical protein